MSGTTRLMLITGLHSPRSVHQCAVNEAPLGRPSAFELAVYPSWSSRSQKAMPCPADLVTSHGGFETSARGPLDSSRSDPSRNTREVPQPSTPRADHNRSEPPGSSVPLICEEPGLSVASRAPSVIERRVC